MGEFADAGAVTSLAEAKPVDAPAEVVAEKPYDLRTRALGVVPWLLPLVVSVLGLHALDVPDLVIAKYAGYFGGCVVLPGVLLLRSLWRSTGSWAEDIGLGAAVGLSYELIGWAGFTALGIEDWLIAWPALVLVVFATSKRLHRYWRIENPARLPRAWSWGVALFLTYALVFGVYYFLDTTAVPPDGVGYYHDLVYHLSLVNEAQRSFPLQLPQISGQRLDYHWFANAHMAAASDITGASTVQVLFRLWILPMEAVAVLIFAALARQVSRVWWSGIIAAAFLCTGQFVDVWAVPASFGLSTMSFVSPSLMYGIVVGTAGALLLLDQLYRGPTSRRTWVLTVLLMFVGSGAKPTTGPLLLGGTGLAALYLLVRNRRIPWRTVFTGVLIVVVTAVTLVTVVGSTAGSKVRLFGILRPMSGYVEATGDSSLAAGPGWTVGALEHGDAVARWGALIVLGTLIVSALCGFTMFGILGHRGTRRDPVAWWLAGAVLTGWLAILLLDHPSAGELFFPRSSLPFATAGTAWLLTSALRHRSRRTKLVLTAVSIALGGGFVVAAGAVRPGSEGSRERMIAALGVPMGVLALLCLLAVLGWFLVARRRRPSWRGLGIPVVALAAFGMTLPSTVNYARGFFEVGVPKVEVPGGMELVAPANHLHPDEQRAAFWLRSNSGEDDIVAGNTACRPARKQPPCDARGWIISGLAGRRALLDGWAYTQQALSRHGVDGKPYPFQPAPWPERAELIKQLFSDPTPGLIRTLREDYHVRWVYADLLAGPVPEQRLGELAVLRHEEPSVLIYELVDPGRVSNGVARGRSR